MKNEIQEYGNFTRSLSAKMERLGSIADDLPPATGRKQVTHADTIHDLLNRGREALRGDPNGTTHAGRVWILLTWIEDGMASKKFPPAVVKSLKQAGFES